MRSTAALKSIEALYKEAETVIGDGVPMVAIVNLRFRLRARTIAASMAIGEAGGDRRRIACDRSVSGGWRSGGFLASRGMAAQPAGEKT